MADSTPSSTTITNLSSSATRFLSTLGGEWSATLSEGGLFSSLLEDLRQQDAELAENSAKSQSKTTTESNKTSSTDTNSLSQTSSVSAVSWTDVPPTVEQVASDLHKFTSKWRSYVQGLKSDHSSAPTVAAQDSSSTTDDTSNVNFNLSRLFLELQALQSQQGSSQSSVSSSEGSASALPQDSTSTDGTTSSWSDLLAQLQKIMTTLSNNTNAVSGDSSAYPDSKSDAQVASDQESVTAPFAQLLDQKTSTDPQKAEKDTSSDALISTPVGSGELQTKEKADTSLSNTSGTPNATAGGSSVAGDQSSYSVSVNAAQTSDVLTKASEAMNDFLELMKSVRAKLNSEQTTAKLAVQDHADTSSDNQTSSNVSVLEDKLKTDLKALINAVKEKEPSNAPGVIESSVGSIDASKIQNGSEASDQEVSQPSSPDSSRNTSIVSALTNTFDMADNFAKHLDQMFGLPSSTIPKLLTPQTSESSSPVENRSSSSVSAPVLSDSGDMGLEDEDQGDTGSSGLSLEGTSNNLMSGVGNSKSETAVTFANQLALFKGSTVATAGLPTAVEQVMFQLSRSIKNGSDQLTLQLHPADLGTINVKLNFGDNGAVTGTVVASHTATLDMLQKDVRSLERALQDAGLRADPGSLQFSLGDPSRGGHQGYQAEGKSSSSGSSSTQSSSSDTAIADRDVDVDNEIYVLTPDRVNLKV